MVMTNCPGSEENTRIVYLDMVKLEKIKQQLHQGSERSVKAKKNILYMILYKGISILAGLLLVPMTINYVNSENYGIWLTLSSMIAWMSCFDIGLNNGLKNKLTEALANKDYSLGKKYVSTTYAILSMIFIPLMFILLFIVPFIQWESLLNINPRSGQSIIVAVCILIVYFCLNFVLSTINVVIMANQQPADASLRKLVQQLVSLAIIYVLTLTTEGNLVNLCLALCASPLIVVLIFNFTLFHGRYAKLAPSLKSVDFGLAPNMMKLGVQFFIIQVAGVIQWQLSNFLIIRYFGATSVTEYNIAHKYFGIMAMVWGILTTPVWAAVTDAITKGDYNWIQNTIDKYLKLFCLFIMGGVMMLLVSPWVYDFWIGDKVSVSLSLSAALLIYNLVIMFSGIYVSVLNGCGHVKIQMYACLVSPLIYLGCFFLCSETFNFGIYSVVIAAVIANFNGLLLAPVQSRHLLNNRKTRHV